MINGDLRANISTLLSFAKDERPLVAPKIAERINTAILH